MQKASHQGLAFLVAVQTRQIKEEDVCSEEKAQVAVVVTEKQTREPVTPEEDGGQGQQDHEPVDPEYKIGM